MDIVFKEIGKPNQSNYINQKRVRRRSQSSANLRYENILFATDSDAD